MFIDTDANEQFLENAIALSIPVSLRYWKDATPGVDEPPPRRVVSPYELREGKDGGMLLVCWSHGSEGVRAFKLGLIGQLQSEAENDEFIHPVEVEA